MYRRNRVVVEAPAKLNLFLDITGLAENGYHEIDTVMQAVDLADVVVAAREPGAGIRVTCSRGDVPDGPANLAHRAAEAFFAAAELPQQGLRIHIDKAIPTQAGMGGGSSDAAAVLVGMNELFEANFTPEQLGEVGVSIGADVPFLVYGGCARAEGIGEKLTPLFPGLRPCWLTIIKPAGGVDTGKAYAAYDARRDIVHASSVGIRNAIATGDLGRAGKGLFNVFEQLADVPQLGRIQSVLKEQGALGALLTGSGNAIFGIFAEREPAEACCTALSMPDTEVFLARPVGYGAKILHRG